MGQQTDNLWSHFNELVLAVLLVTFVAFDIHMIHHAMDAGSVTWLQGIVGQVLAALLTLMVKSTSTSSSFKDPKGDTTTKTEVIK